MQGNDNNDGNGERKVILPPRNALKLPGIMDKILSELEFEDVKNARSVSKVWRNHGLTLWRNKLAVFNVNKKSQRALKESSDVNSKSKNKLYLLRERPFKQYKLTSEGGYHHFPPARPAGDDSLLFWNHCGPNLTYLDIGNVSMFNKDMFEGLKWIFNSCPNLEELKLCPYRRIRKGESTQEDEEIQYVVPAHAVTAAAAETVVARKLKYLSIFTAEFSGANCGMYLGLFTNDFLLARRFFNLMPNLKGLELDVGRNSVKYVVDGLKRLTLGLLSLEKLYLRFGLVMETDAWLLNYIRELGTAQKLKALCFTENLKSIWNHPSRLKNILKSIRPRVEEFELKVSIPALVDLENERFRSFDLFRYNFAHLKSLTLKVKTPVLREGCTCWTAMSHLAFDFSALRGTPNLEYFFFGCRPISHVPWLTRTLTAADVQGNGGIPNWRLDDNAIERVDAEEADNNIGIEDGDENLFAPEEGETVLEKMKELHFEGCFSVEALQALGRMMPHLKKLETILDSEPFREVFQIWGGNEGKLKNVKVMLLQRSGEMTTLINRKKREFPNVKIVEAIVEENW